MESWREELYHGAISELRARIREGAGGSGTSNSSKERGGWTWKNHRYVRIENGRYIYPEDLERNKNKNGNGETNSNMSDSLREKLLNADYSSVLARQQSANQEASSKSKKSSGRSSSRSSSKSSTEKETKEKKEKKEKTEKETKKKEEEKEVKTTDKGSVDTLDDLPKKAEIGDLYTINALNRKVYWDGEMWVPEESNKTKKKKTESEEIADNLESAIEKTMDTLFSDIINGKTAMNGENFISYLRSTFKTLANKAVSIVKKSDTYKLGAKLLKEEAELKEAEAEEKSQEKKKSQKSSSKSSKSGTSSKSSTKDDDSGTTEFDDDEINSIEQLLNSIDLPGDKIEHHGILGQKWGVRRFQNNDGTLTELGKKHLSKDSDKFNKLEKNYNKKSANLAKRQQKFQKRAKKPIITDIDLELKRRQGVKLSKAYRKYLKAGNKFVKNYDRMKDNYGINNLSAYQVNKGRAYTEEWLRNKGVI